MSTYCQINIRLAIFSVFIVYSVLNVEMLVGTFNQENAQVGAFSLITNLRLDLKF